MSVGMPAQVKLLGPDLGNPLVVEVEPSDTIEALKNKALEKWPAGATRAADRTHVEKSSARATAFFRVAHVHPLSRRVLCYRQAWIRPLLCR